MMLGEIFDLEELAEDCAADGVWEFLLSAPPLRVAGGVGSPVSPARHEVSASVMCLTDGPRGTR